MDQPEPDTPFAAVSAQTTKLGRVSALMSGVVVILILDMRLTRDWENRYTKATLTRQLPLPHIDGSEQAFCSSSSSSG